MDKNKLYELVTSILAKELQIKPSDIEPQKHLAAYGLGSLQAISLAGEFNTILGTKIDFSHLYEYSHLNSLVDFLQEALAKQSKLKFKKKAIEDNKKSLFPCIEDKLKAYNPALYFDEINGLPENKITIENQNYLNFSSYNYLGFAQDKDIINSTINAIEQYGTSVAASRLVGGQRAIHRELEQHIASFLNAEDALVFNSGHATNVTTLGHLFNSNDLIILDELSHNSLVQGAQLAGASIKFFKHNDPDSLAQLLENNINAYAKTLVVTEGIFSMDGDIAPIDKYLALKSKFDFFIYIDEAHSLGVLGEKGRGIVEHYALKSKQIDIWMGTLSKA
ncbi:MAG: aminotransferase class I/II-fold pyridoxal phosphate-dependent enzyme, partial [Proteobacteria bacterium]|nr:aminotransferase class I/II-fold pyridoxal phosphate-dependent enzyme [Pseudomonadota bacterium]